MTAQHLSKFTNTCISTALHTILNNTATAYKGDLNVDLKTLKSEAEHPSGTVYLWLVRRHGTCLEKERDVFIRESPAYNTWQFYTSLETPVYAYAITVHRLMDSGCILGDIHQLDYREHALYVEDHALPTKNIMATYENGTRIFSPNQAVTARPDPELGKYISSRYVPNDEALLDNILRIQKILRDNQVDGSLSHHLRMIKLDTIMHEADRIQKFVAENGIPENSIALDSDYQKLTEMNDINLLTQMLGFECNFIL